MKIYNTLTKSKDDFIPLNEGKVSIYACGPTVYNYIHIGNARPICVFDTLRRFMEYRGFNVCFAQNFTDIDDKIINKANQENIGWKEVADKFIAEYKTDAAGLNIKPANFHPKATDNIDNIISFISQLIEKDFAYVSGGDVYFKTKNFKEYGKLSHMPLEDLEAGARINVNEQKSNPMDFALWKAAKEGEPFWESPFGKGRPGWHIECSAMAKNILGDTIDIHCGGQDLIFPHHENEIAQSEALNDAPFANFWMHNGYINVDNRKMSKSLNNFFTVREIADKFGYEPIRFMMIAAHYRTPINYSIDVINQSVNALDRLYSCRDNLDFALQNAAATNDDDDQLIAKIENYKKRFINYLEDDFNTADALSVIFELTRDINTWASGADIKSKKVLDYAASIFDELNDVLGLMYNRKTETINDDIEKLIQQRQDARKNKDFALADSIRDQLLAQGIVLMDTPQGVKWSYNN